MHANGGPRGLLFLPAIIRCRRSVDSLVCMLFREQNAKNVTHDQVSSWPVVEEKNSRAASAI